MPQAHRLNLFTKSPIGQWRCPKCGLPMFLACIEPAIEVDHERRTFECSTCAYGETITVNFRIDGGDPVHQKGPGEWTTRRNSRYAGLVDAPQLGRPMPSRA
jgi:hypothetical protein